MEAIHATYENNKKYLKNHFAGILGFGVKGGEEALSALVKTHVEGIVNYLATSMEETTN